MFEFLPLVPGATAVATLGVGAYRERSRRQELKDGRLPPGAAELAANGLYLPESYSKGRLTVASSGTYGLGKLEKIIEAYSRANCLDDIGAVIVNEFDERQRTRFEQTLARNWPRLYSRSVFNRSILLPGGLQGRSVEEVESKEIRAYWQPRVNETLEWGCQLIRGTERSIYDGTSLGQPGHDPAVILLLASPGGHAALGPYIGARLQDEFPLASTYVITICSDKDDRRKEFPNVLERYQRAGFARFLCAGDNRRNPLAFDYAVSTFLASSWVAPLMADRADEGWNTLADLHPRGRNGVVVPRLWIRMIPVKHTRSKQPCFFTFEEAAIRAAMDGISAVDREDQKAIQLATPKPDTSRYVVVTLPVQPDALIRVKDQVEEMLTAAGWFEHDYNRRLIWAPTSEAMTTATDSVRMSVVMMEAAIDGIEGLKRLAVPGLPSVVAGAPSSNGRSGSKPRSMTGRATRQQPSPSN